MRPIIIVVAALIASCAALAQECATIQGTGDLRVRLDGRVTFDGAMYLPSTDLSEVKYDSDRFRFSNAANLSQLRLGFNAFFGEKWLGRFDVDFSNRRVNLTDIILVHYFNKHSRAFIGYFKDPVSMDNSTPSRQLTLQSPMAVTALTRGERYLGVTYVQYGRHHWLAGGLYAGTVGGRTTVPNRGDDGYGVAARAAYIPVNNDYTTIHLGAYGRWRRPEPSEGTPEAGSRAVVYAVSPESSIDAHRFVGASVGDVKHYWLGGVEAAIKFDRLYFGGEYLFNVLHRRDLHHNVISGWTLTGSYMLKGRQRTYVASDGLFNPVASVRSGGSLELIGRLGYLNLNDREATKPLWGGRAFSALGGVNWYPIANVLLAFNYTYMNHDMYANELGRITGIGTDGIDFHTLQLRAQFVF